MYLEREANMDYPAFQSVILAGVTDIKHLKSKIRDDEQIKVNSPWNIVANFELMTQDAVKKQKHEAMELLYYWYRHFSELRKFREAWWAVVEETK